MSMFMTLQHGIFVRKEIMKEEKIRMNYVAVVATGMAAFILSIFWYSPILFGGIWQKYRHDPNPAIPEWTMGFAPLREIIASFVVAYCIVRLKLDDWRQAAKLMLLLWVAFHAVGMAGAVLWDNMKWELGAVHAGDWLMKMLFMGITLTIWLNRRSSTHQREMY